MLYEVEMRTVVQAGTEQEAIERLKMLMSLAADRGIVEYESTQLRAQEAKFRQLRH